MSKKQWNIIQCCFDWWYALLPFANGSICIKVMPVG